MSACLPCVQRSLPSPAPGPRPRTHLHLLPLLLSPMVPAPCTCRMSQGHVHMASDVCFVLKAGKSRGKQVWGPVPQIRTEGRTGERDGEGAGEGLAEVGLGPKDAATQGGTPPSEDEWRHLPGKKLLLSASVTITCNSNDEARACASARAHVHTHACAAPPAPSPSLQPESCQPGPEPWLGLC